MPKELSEEEKAQREFFAGLQKSAVLKRIFEPDFDEAAREKCLECTGRQCNSLFMPYAQLNTDVDLDTFIQNLMDAFPGARKLERKGDVILYDFYPDPQGTRIHRDMSGVAKRFRMTFEETIDRLKEGLGSGTVDTGQLLAYSGAIVALSLVAGFFTFLTRQTIIAIEGGKYAPSLELAFKIALVFGVPLQEVFSYELEGDEK